MVEWLVVEELVVEELVVEELVVGELVVEVVVACSLVDVELVEVVVVIGPAGTVGGVEGSTSVVGRTTVVGDSVTTVSCPGIPVWFLPGGGALLCAWRSPYARARGLLFCLTAPPSIVHVSQPKP